MRQISNSTELQERIQFLERRTRQQEENLKERFQATYESIKPQNLIKNAFSDAVAEPEVRSNIINTSVGVIAGLITRKLIVGSSAGIIKKLAGTAIQLGLTKFVANKFPVIQEKAQALFQKKPNGKKIIME